MTDRRTFLILSALVVLLALVAREFYIHHAILWFSTNGDSGDYLKYADNILRGYFGEGDTPDGYRPPGYPVMLALAKLGDGDPLRRVMHWQAFLGAGTVALLIALARQWLPRWAALVAGLLLAVWPHHIAFTSEYLSEILLGFLLTASLLAAATAKAWPGWTLAGLLFGLTSLVNPLCAPVAVLAGFAMIERSPVRWLALLTPVVLIAGSWATRDAPGGSDRIWQNLVQGSHPMYHEAFQEQRGDPKLRELNRQIREESDGILSDKVGGLLGIAERLAESPGDSLRWYVSKAWHLWDWDVRVSAHGGPYVHEVLDPPLDHPPLSVAAALTWGLNPVLFWLAVFALLVAPAGVGRMLALAFLYFTAAHVVLQADPRYSIPYRPIEFCLALWTVAYVTRLVFKTPAPQPRPSTGSSLTPRRSR